MASLFISDLHLSASCPKLTDLFFKFLAQEAKNAEALYILGDLFEAWVGIEGNAHDREVFEALHQVRKAGVPLYFIPGNRDFLIKSTFCEQYGIELLADPSVITLYGKSVIITHGDQLCTLDTGYQNFRRFVRNPWIKALFLNLPIFIRQKIALKLRGQSSRSQNIPSKDPAKWDVTQGAVEDILKKHSSYTLIHGHTHKPQIHAFKLEEKSALRVVLGDWGERGSFCEYAESGPKLKTFA